MGKIIFVFLFAALVVCGCKTNTPEEECDLASSTRCGNEVVRPPIKNFSELNPNYKDRAGSFYDIEYVSPSAKSLFKIADIEPNQMRETLRILRLFVDEWLDLYVENNAVVSQDQADKCVQDMDRRFEDLLNTLQYKQYCIWRDDPSGEHNHLRFLMSRPSVDIIEKMHNQRIDPTVKTPVESGNVQGTQQLPCIVIEKKFVTLTEESAEELGIDWSTLPLPTENNSPKRIEPVVTTPVESGEVQGTANNL